MKQPYSVYIGLAILLLLNTTYFWEKWLGGWGLLLTLLIIVLSVALCIKLLVLFVRLVKNRFADSTKTKQFLVLLSIVMLLVFFPFGIIDFRRFEAKNIFSVQREGVANCMLYVNLKEDGGCVEKQICFGTYEKSGRYKVKGDSIFLTLIKARLMPA